MCQKGQVSSVYSEAINAILIHPRTISIYDGPPTVINVPVNAGDCVIFTEALYHGGRRWTEDYPRFTIFNRYIDKGSHSALPIENYKHLVSDEVYELEQPAVHGQQKAGRRTAS